MAQDRFEKFTTEQLVKRIRAALIFVLVLITFGLIGLILTIYDFILERNLNNTLLASALLCFFIALFIYIGIKSTKTEIARRESI